MSKSVLLCISTLLDGGNRARAQSLKMGAGAIFRDWIRVLTLLRARADYSKMFNLSDSLGRPLFANIQVRATATHLASARSSDTPHPTPKDQPCLRCLPEDRRARKVRIHSNPRCCPPFPQPQPLSFCRCTHKLAEVWNHEALGKASTSFTHPFALPPRRCQDGCRQTKWCAPIVTS